MARKRTGPTQVDQVLQMLQNGPVCATTILNKYIPRGADCIYRLRKAGHNITSRPCCRPGHLHNTHQIEYVLQPSDRLF